MAISYVGGNTATGTLSNSGTVELAWPAGHQADDIAIVWAVQNDNNGALESSSAGFDAEEIGSTAGGRDRHWGFWVKRATSSSEPNFVLENTTSTTSQPVGMLIDVFRGVDTTTAMDVAHVGANLKDNDPTQANEPITTATPGAMVGLLLGSTHDGITDIGTPPTGFTYGSTSIVRSDGQVLSAYQLDITPDGTVTPTAWGLTHGGNSNADQTQFTYALRPAAAGGATVAVGQATEADTAGVITPAAGAATTAVSQATEADTAGTVAPASGGATVAVGQATEADTAGVITPAAGAATTAVGQSAEAATAGVITPSPSGAAAVAVGQAAEADTAGTVAPASGGATVAVGQSAEAATAGVITPSPAGAATVAVGQAGPELATAGIITPSPGSVAVPQNQFLELDTAFAVTPVAGTVAVAVGQATEVDTAGTITPVVAGAVPIGQAAEAATAGAITPAAGAATVTFGQAGPELATAGAITPAAGAATVTFGQAGPELATAGAITPAAAGAVAVTVGQATEADTAGVITPFRAGLVLAVLIASTVEPSLSFSTVAATLQFVSTLKGENQ